MKNKLKLCCILLCLTMCQSVFALYQNKLPLAATQIGSGGFWHDIDNVKLLGGYTTCTLGLSGGSTISPNSNAMRVSDFNFNIPSTATVTGIQVLIYRYAYGYGTASDRSVKLMLNNIPATADKKKAIAYGAYPGTTSFYGNNTDLWGLGSTTPAQINSSGFGVHFSCKNTSASYSAYVFVDYIRVKVFYTNGPRLESQTSESSFSNQAMQVFPNPVKDNLQLTLFNDASSVSIKIYNMHGQLMLEKNVSDIHANEARQIEVAALSKGIYLMSIISDGNEIRKKFIKQ